MYSTDHLWTVVLFAVLAQGLFLACVLLTRQDTDRRASRLLGALCLVLALLTLEELVDSANLYQSLPHSLLSSFPLPLAIGPLLWLIALRFEQPSRRFRSRDWLHFLPMFAVAIYLAPFYWLDNAAKLAALDGDWGRRIGPLVLLKGIHVLAYLAIAIGYCGRALKTGGCANPARMSWYRRVLLIISLPTVLLHLLYFFPELAPIESDRVGSLVVAVVIYAFAYAAMKWPPAAESEPAMSAGKVPLKYRTSALDPGSKTRLRDRLLKQMQSDQPFRDPDVSLADLAETLDISSHSLSQVLNEVLDTNFHRFINNYLINWVKEKLADPRQDHKTLLELGFEAGFNSKTSFNRVFKELTDLTPTDYRRLHNTRESPQTTASTADTDNRVALPRR